MATQRTLLSPKLDALKTCVPVGYRGEQSTMVLERESDWPAQGKLTSKQCRALFMEHEKQLRESTEEMAKFGEDMASCRVCGRRDEGNISSRWHQIQSEGPPNLTCWWTSEPQHAGCVRPRALIQPLPCAAIPVSSRYPGNNLILSK